MGAAIDAHEGTLVPHAGFEIMGYVQLCDTSMLQGAENLTLSGFFSSLICLCQNPSGITLLPHFLQSVICILRQPY